MDPILKARNDIQAVIRGLDDVLNEIPSWFKLDLLKYSSMQELREAVEAEKTRHAAEVTEWLCKRSEKSLSRIFRTRTSGVFSSLVHPSDRKDLFATIYPVLVKKLAVRGLDLALGDDDYIYVTKSAGSLVRKR